jgi:hypothetical protein
MCEDHWKDIIKTDIEKDAFDRDDLGGDPGLGYGTRNVRQRAEQGYTQAEIDALLDAQNQETETFKRGVKCFHCDNRAEWKCRNGLHNGCSYEGPSDDGVQVCGASSKFADENYPEGHKTYELNRNGGHDFVDIEQYFTLDPKFGYHHDKHDPNKYRKR